MELKLFALSLLALAFITLLFFFIRYAIRTKKQLTQQEETIKQLQHGQTNDQSKLVASTLNPHLFKNVLNSIQSHAYQTYFALDKLANVLDYILYDSRRQFVSPKEEIQFAQDLIEINKIKLSPLFELQVKVKVNEDDAYHTQKIMAPLISIDLIENAFKHADIQSQDAFIKIIMELQDGIFSLTVANKISEKPPLQKEKGGIGSATLDQRLKLIYTHHYSLNRVIENNQYIAELKINLREYKNEVHPS